MTRLYQPSFTGGELSSSLYARTDLAKYAAGLKKAKNVFVHAHGGVSNRAGFEFIGTTAGNKKARQIPFVFDPVSNQTYNIELTNQKMRFYRAGAVITQAAKAIINISQDGTSLIISCYNHGFDNGDEVIIGNKNYIVSDGFSNGFRIRDLYGAYVVIANMPPYGGGSSASKIYEVATPYLENDLPSISFAQENDVMYLAHRNYPPHKLVRYSDNNWAITAVTFAPSIGAPNGVNAYPIVNTAGQPGYIATVYSYVVSSVSNINGDESLISAGTSCVNDLTIVNGRNRVQWLAVANAGRYIIYKLDNGRFGYIGSTTALYFDDENITADLSDAPQQGVNPFTGWGNYPGCVAFFEQRLAFGGTYNNPSAVYLGQSSNYENFGAASPAKASDAITFRIRSNEKNDIISLISTRGLGVFTTAAEWIVNGGSQDFLSPSNTVIRVQSKRGSSSITPIVVGNVMLFSQARGGVVRDFSYDMAQDSFTGSDLTIFSSHLFKNKQIISWAYAQSPHSIVWCVLDDGSLLSFTYMREHEVWGWTRHETDGAFINVNVVPENKEDVPYFVIRRMINGLPRYHIERLHSRNFATSQDAFFVDSGLSYNGAPATVVSGLDHLNGKTVKALADGNVVSDLLVVNGSVTLPYAASKIHIGLSYEAVIQTLPLSMGDINGLGNVQGRLKSISKVTIRVEETRGIWLGTDDYPKESGKLVEYKQRQNENWNEAIGLFTGDIEMTPTPTWNTQGQVCIKQFDPLPMTILAIMPDITLGG